MGKLNSTQCNISYTITVDHKSKVALLLILIVDADFNDGSVDIFELVKIDYDVEQNFN